MTDPEEAEEFAEEVGVDPTPQEVDEYLDLTRPGDGEDPTGGSGA